jgi:CheY-like chemotaxis protein
MGEKREKVFTTFQIADMCSVRPTTVIKWANQERLKAFTTPGGHRRVTAGDLLEFLRHYKLPIPHELAEESAPRVLIVDDEPDIGNLLVRSFKRAFPHSPVQWVKDGVEGLLALGHSPPDLMVLDVQMPTVDGERVLATLRSDPQTRAIRVIGMTGKRLTSPTLEFMTKHTDAFFHKPFRVEELLAKAKGLLESHARSGR